MDLSGILWLINAFRCPSPQRLVSSTRHLPSTFTLVLCMLVSVLFLLPRYFDLPVWYLGLSRYCVILGNRTVVLYITMLCRIKQIGENRSRVRHAILPM